MARSRRRRRTTTRRTSPPWVWLATGLFVGLFVAFLVYLQVQPEREEPPGAPVALDIPKERDTREVRKTEKSKPIPPPPKSRFDFYDLLPEMEVIVPDEDIQGATSQGIKQVEEPGTYLLQAGSFRNKAQADQLRAKLALLGLETSIQTVSVDSKQAWHRVRVGPFKNLGELNKARSLLKKNGIDAILIRLKG